MSSPFPSQTFPNSWWFQAKPSLCRKPGKRTQRKMGCCFQNNQYKLSLHSQYHALSPSAFCFTTWSSHVAYPHICMHHFYRTPKFLGLCLSVCARVCRHYHKHMHYDMSLTIYYFIHIYRYILFIIYNLHVQGCLHLCLKSIPTVFQTPRWCWRRHRIVDANRTVRRKDGRKMKWGMACHPQSAELGELRLCVWKCHRHGMYPLVN